MRAIWEDVIIIDSYKSFDDILSWGENMMKKQQISRMVIWTMISFVLIALVTLQTSINTFAIENVKTNIVTRNVATEAELMAAIEDATVDVIHLQKDITVSRSADGKDNAFVINRAVTITGEGTLGGLRLERAGIILGGAVAFENMSIYFANPVRNAIIANGYTLTLNNVSNGGSSYNIDIFCGAITDYNGGNAEEIPSSGMEANVIIKGTNTLTGVSASVDGGNIYAGSLSDVGNGLEDAPNEYNGKVNITIEKGASGFGKIIAHGARENREGGYPDEWKSSPSLYKVIGNVNINLNACKTVVVNGATGGEKNAAFTYKDDGNGYPCSPTLVNIAGITLLPSEEVTYLEPDIAGECSLQFISVPANTRLSFVGVDDGNISVASYSGGGEIVFSNTQALRITEQISGFTKVAVGEVSGDRLNSTGVIEPDTTYITVAVSEAENYGFELLPNRSNHNMVLENDGDGNWVTVRGESFLIINEIENVANVEVPELDDYGLASEIHIPFHVNYATESEYNFIGHIPMLVTVNGRVTNTELGYMGYQYVTGVTNDDILIWFDYNGDDESIYIENYDGYEYAVPAGRYEISMTIPERYMSNAVAKTISFVLTVTCTEHRGGTATSDSQAICEVCGTAYGELKPKPPVHVHNWSYTADNGVITAVCLADDCDMSEESVEMTIVVPDESDLFYDGMPKNAMVQMSVGDILEPPILSYANQSGEVLESAPVNAGTYLASITVGEGNASQTAYVEFTIRKNDASIMVEQLEYNKTFGDSSFTLDVSDTNQEADVQYAVISSMDLNGNMVEKDAIVTMQNNVVHVHETGTAVIEVTLAESANYNTATSKRITIHVKKADAPSTVPETMIRVMYSQKTVGVVDLPEGWVWSETDRSKSLEVGVPVEATAIYNGVNKGNYVTESVTIKIIRQGCPHTGEKIRKDDRKATCEVEGYTGDVCCVDCGVQIATGTKIDKLTVHMWDDGVVTKGATPAQNGEKTYTCTVCKTTKIEDIPALGAPKVGTKEISDDGKAFYKITTSGLVKGTVKYIAPTDSKKTNVTIPSTVVITGVTYKVTAIEKDAFQNNKHIKSITIGKNVKSIGTNAFYNCAKLRTVKFGSNVTTIGDKAFYKCVALTTINLSAEVKTIGKQAFYGCKKATSITLGTKVNNVGSKAFYGCSKVKTLTIKSTKLTINKLGSKAFGKTPKSMTVKIPKKKSDAYKSMLIKCGVHKKAKFKKI